MGKLEDQKGGRSKKKELLNRYGFKEIGNKEIGNKEIGNWSDEPIGTFRGGSLYSVLYSVQYVY